MLDLLLLLLGGLRAVLRSRVDLGAENPLLRQQLAVLARPTRKGPNSAPETSCSGSWPAGSARAGAATSSSSGRRPCSAGIGRAGGCSGGGGPDAPSAGGGSAPRCALITIIARDNPLWGAERIRGEPLKLGIVVSNRSIRRYRGRQPAPPPSQTWHIFLANHRPRIWAADLLTVRTLTFETLYVLLFIAHGRRELVHWN